MRCPDENRCPNCEEASERCLRGICASCMDDLAGEPLWGEVCRDCEESLSEA